MKNTLKILLLAAGIMIVQACGPKKNREANEETSVVKEIPVTTVADRRAKFEKQRADRAEIRRLEYEKLSLNTPTYTDAKGNLVYNKAESNPSFVGGNKAMMAYLRENVKFPQDALDKQDEGIVYVDFVIDKTGVVREVEVTEKTNEGVAASFRSEAARVVASMPKWTPGIQRGKAVDVKYSLPISFELQ
jgi:outer membrane biosynthesis protein TonB